MFEKILNFFRQVIHRMLPYKQIETAEHIDTPLTPEMIMALELWRDTRPRGWGKMAWYP